MKLYNLSSIFPFKWFTECYFKKYLVDEKFSRSYVVVDLECVARSYFQYFTTSDTFNVQKFYFSISNFVLRY